MGMKCNQAIGTVFDNVKKVGGYMTAPIREAAGLYGSIEEKAAPDWAAKMAKSGGGMGTIDPVTSRVGLGESLKRAHQTNGTYSAGKMAKTAGVIGAGGLAVGAVRSIPLTKEDKANIAAASTIMPPLM